MSHTTLSIQSILAPDGNLRPTKDISAERTPFGEDDNVRQQLEAMLSQYSISQGYSVVASELPLQTDRRFYSQGYFSALTDLQDRTNHLPGVFTFSISESVARKKEDIREKREDIREKILGYVNLPKDFDGDDGHAPDAKDILNAVSFIPHIPDAAMEKVIPMVDGGGDVGFEWGREIDLEVGFMRGTISFYGDMPNGEGVDGKEVYNGGGVVPEGLRRLMSAIFPE